MRDACFFQDVAECLRPLPLALIRPTAPVSTAPFRQESVHVKHECLQRIPLHIVDLTGLPLLLSIFSTIEKRLCHQKLVATLVVEARNDQQAETTEGAKQATHFTNELQRVVNRACILNLREGHLVCDGVLKGLVIRHVAFG